MIFVYPTDTAYAIGCDARDGESIRKIFKIKRREESKILPLIASDIDMVSQWCELSGLALKLAQKYWPGPLTLVLPVKKKGLSESVIQEGTIAIRVPDSEEARGLSKEINAPIVSTSANKAGNPNCYSIESIKQSLGNSFKLIDRVIDKGELTQREASTIAKYENGNIKIIRQGDIKIK